MNPTFDPADFFQRFSTKVLWHFTGYNKTPSDAFNILTSILQSNILRVSQQEERVIMHGGQPRYGRQVACLCDIPFRDLRIHMLRYGHFGIAFNKTDAITNGHFNPVFYVHRKSALFEQVTGLLKKLDGEVEPNSPLFRSLEDFLLAIGSYVKPGDLNSIIAVDPKLDSSQDNNFYYEREWRTTSQWNFTDNSIAAIMMPRSYLKVFQDKWKNRFATSSIISSEMVEIL